MDSAGSLLGRHVRLDPLEPHHAAALVEAAAGAAALYAWSSIPATLDEADAYIARAIAWRDAGTAMPFAIVRLADERVVGSTRFFDLERWPWPPGHPRHGRTAPDVGEIGYSWLARSAVGTPINTEMKRLMLGHAFEAWGVERICFHTDVRNERSKRALEGIGARFEGVLRAHRLAADHTFRDSARYSIVAREWPDVRRHLDERLAGLAGQRRGRGPIGWRGDERHLD